jgi:hypothetical protein
VLEEIALLRDNARARSSRCSDQSEASDRGGASYEISVNAGEAAALERDTRAWQKDLQVQAMEELSLVDGIEMRIKGSALYSHDMSSHVSAREKAQKAEAAAQNIPEAEREALGRVFRTVDMLSYKLACLHAYLDLDEGQSSMRSDADQLLDNVASLQHLVADTRLLVLQAAQEQERAHLQVQKSECTRGIALEEQSREQLSIAKLLAHEVQAHEDVCGGAPKESAIPSVPFYCTYSSPYTRHLFPSPHKGQDIFKDKRAETDEREEGLGVSVDSMLSSAVTPLTHNLHSSARQRSGGMIPSTQSPLYGNRQLEEGVVYNATTSHQDVYKQPSGPGDTEKHCPSEQQCASALATSFPPLPCFISPALSSPLHTFALDTSRHNEPETLVSTLQVSCVRVQ